MSFRFDAFEPYRKVPDALVPLLFGVFVCAYMCAFYTAIVVRAHRDRFDDCADAGADAARAS